MPVQNIEEAAVFYQQRLGFTALYQSDGFARLARDEAEVLMTSPRERTVSVSS